MRAACGWCTKVNRCLYGVNLQSTSSNLTLCNKQQQTWVWVPQNCPAPTEAPVTVGQQVLAVVTSPGGITVSVTVPLSILACLLVWWYRKRKRALYAQTHPEWVVSPHNVQTEEEPVTFTPPPRMQGNLFN